MQRFGVSALVPADPINIYHATGFWPRTLEMGHLGSTIAVVVPDPTQPAALITPQFLHYFQDVGDDDGALEILLHTAPDSNAPSGAAEPFYFRDTADGRQDSFERASRQATLGVLEARGAYPGAAAALGDVLARHGVTGTIAVDSFLAEALLGAGSGFASVGPGDRYDDLRNAFFAETGRRGGLPVFLDIDSASYEHRDGIIRDGRCFMIDAVARYERYHGDFGRTVFVGTPEPALQRAMQAAILASEAITKVLAPGLRYSDVTRIGRQAVADAGLDVLIVASPHSVGLFHTDGAFLDDGMVFAKGDHLIEKDMVLSIDCPALDTDLGGTVHLEDLWLVTENGCEALNDTGQPFLQI